MSHLSYGLFLSQDGTKEEANESGDDNVEVSDPPPQASAVASTSSSSVNGTKRRKRDEAGVDGTSGSAKTEGGEGDSNNDGCKEDEKEGGGDGVMNVESGQDDGNSAVPEQVRDQLSM